MPAMWKTKDGRKIAVSEMDDQHIANAIRLFKRKLKDSDATSRQLSSWNARLTMLRNEQRRRGATRVDPYPENSNDRKRERKKRRKPRTTLENYTVDELLDYRAELHEKLMRVDDLLDKKLPKPSDEPLDEKLDEADAAMDALAAL